MTVQYDYDGAHGMTFVEASNAPVISANFSDSNAKHTWTQWRMIPKNIPRFTPPTRKEHMIDLPGGSGNLDISSAISVYPLFENRTGSFEFYVPEFWHNGQPRPDTESTKGWCWFQQEISRFLNGRPRGCILDDWPGHAFVGYFTVGELTAEADYSSLTIDYDVYPYCIRQPDIETYTLTGTETEYTLEVGEMPVTNLMIKLNGANDSGNVKIAGVTSPLNAYWTNYARLVDNLYAFQHDSVKIKLSGSGTATVKSYAGWL